MKFYSVFTASSSQSCCLVDDETDLEVQYFLISSADLPGILPAIKFHLVHMYDKDQTNPQIFYFFFSAYQELNKALVNQQQRTNLSPTNLNILAMSVSSSSENSTLESFAVSSEPEQTQISEQDEDREGCCVGTFGVLTSGDIWGGFWVFFHGLKRTHLEKGLVPWWVVLIGEWEERSTWTGGLGGLMGCWRVNCLLVWRYMFIYIMNKQTHLFIYAVLVLFHLFECSYVLALSSHCS